MSTPPPIMRTPRSVDIDITSRCNLRCRYCYFFDNPEVEYNDLAGDEWMRFFDELGRLKVMDVRLAGGEPFARRDLPQLLDSIVKNRMRFSILSNGALIDDDTAALLAHTGRCNSVQISIDGSCAEVHDTLRGEGSFDGAVRGLEALRRHEVPVAVRVTIHRHNVDDLESTARFLLDQLELPRFSTNTACSIGSCHTNDGDVLLSVEQRQEAMTTLERLSDHYGGRITADAGPLAEARSWRHMETARRLDAGGFPNGGRLTGCGCVFSKIAVRADGAIVPCTMLAHMELGRINRDPLGEVWLTSPDLDRLRHRRTTRLEDFEFCDSCPYVQYCTGNCPALAYTLTGDVNHPSPDACLRRFLAAGGHIPDDDVRPRKDPEAV